MSQTTKFLLVLCVCRTRRSEVWRAIRLADGMPVICKILNDSCAVFEDAARFRHEFALLRRLSSPAIVEAIELTDIEGRLAIVFRDIGATSLDILFEGMPPDIGTFLDIAIAVVDGLAALHGAGMVHKDITPSNIVWNPENGTVNLIDFGIASELESEESQRLAADAIEGTLAFLAPEQSGRMNRGVDYRADFYGLGATFHWLLTGVPPFTETDPLDLVHCHVARMPSEVHLVNPSVPAVLSAIVARMMSKDPEDRYQSSFGLRADLGQCRTQWKAAGAIASFDIGAFDRRPVLRVPQRLYGRETQLRVLNEALSRVVEGARECVLVGGYSGIGKSALVNELQGAIIAAGGFFIAGKFELLRRNIPYAPFIQAFGELFRRADGLIAVRRARFAGRITQALGHEAAVMTEVIPDLERLIGKQPPVPALNPAEAQNRFIHVFRKLARVLATADSPCVLFLDDLQWADLSSLKLIQALATDPELRHLLLIGAYRDNEVDSVHPLTRGVAAVEQAGTPVQRISLQGLDEGAVAQLLADALSSGRAGLESLASLVWAKTLGNPFFIGQYLKLLEREKSIVSDQAAGKWTWDEAAIQARSAGDDLADFLLRRLRELPDVTVSVLGAAACIGTEFDLAVLAGAARCTPEEAARQLWPALVAGLIVPQGGAYRYADFAGMAERVQYRFAHDRVEQAAYDLFHEQARLACHLDIGRVLRGLEGGGNARLFDVVHQLNRASSLLTEEESIALAEDNLRAARAARASAAFGPALDYYGAGVKLLPEDAWERLRPLAYALHLESAELAVWSGQSDAVIQRVDTILAHAPDVLEQTSAYRILIQLHIAENRNSTALDVGRKALAALGEKLPRQVHVHHILLEVMRTKMALRGYGEESLASRPAATDPRILRTAEILVRLGAASYLSEPNLFPVLMCRAVRLYLEHGSFPRANSAFACHAIICAKLGDLEGAAKFGRVALRIGESMAEPAYAISLIKTFVDPWTGKAIDIADGLVEAYHLAMARGEFQAASFSLYHSANLRLVGGTSLDDLKGMVDKYRAITLAMNQAAVDHVFRLLQQIIANMQGDCLPADRFSGPFFDEAADMEQLRKLENKFGLQLAYAQMAYVQLLCGQVEQAMRLVELRRPFMKAAAGHPHELRYEAICSIILLAGWDRLDAAQRRRTLADAGKLMRRARKLSAMAPHNFEHLHALLAVEVARARGARADALPLYRQAVEAARKHGYQHDEGLAAERAGEFALALGEREQGEALLRQALAAYTRWGAKVKAAQISSRLTALFDVREKMPAPLSTYATTTTTGFGGTALDVATLMRASQALAENIRLSDLLQTTMRLVIANAGATRGYLLLQSDGEWHVEAAAHAERGEMQVLMSRPVRGPEPVLAASIVDEVASRIEPLVIEDLASSEQYRSDPYVAAARPRSLLCMPLRNRNRLNGILYLENNLAPGVFSHERVELLRMISTLISISLENAHLYEGMERMNRTLEAKVEERTRELEQLAITDQLTGLHNRRKLDEVMAYEIARVKRHEGPLSVILGDIDKFKSVNDRYGHQAGDSVLAAFAAILRDGVRTSDTLGRWGGEEFMVICPNTDLEGAMTLAEKLRSRVEQYDFPVVGRRTCSFGVAQLTGDETADGMIARADAELYRAKETGRNRVQGAPPQTVE